MDLFSPVQMVMIGAIGVMLFGERLPEVARSVGKQITDLKKSLRGLQDQITTVVTTPVHSGTASDGEGPRVIFEDQEEHEEATAPKFEPPPAEPTDPGERTA